MYCEITYLQCIFCIFSFHFLKGGVATSSTLSLDPPLYEGGIIFYGLRHIRGTISVECDI